jgi:hypothetical protein
MMKLGAALLACLVAVALTTANAGAAEAGQQSKIMKLHQEVRELRGQLRSTRKVIRRMHGSLSKQVAAVAATSPLPEVKTVILDPLVKAWPCESSHSEFFGSYVWSASLELSAMATDPECPWATVGG